MQEPCLPVGVAEGYFLNSSMGTGESPGAPFPVDCCRCRRRDGQGRQVDSMDKIREILSQPARATWKLAQRAAICCRGL